MTTNITDSRMRLELRKGVVEATCRIDQQPSKQGRQETTAIPATGCWMHSECQYSNRGWLHVWHLSVSCLELSTRLVWKADQAAVPSLHFALAVRGPGTTLPASRMGKWSKCCPALSTR